MNLRLLFLITMFFWGSPKTFSQEIDSVSINPDTLYVIKQFCKSNQRDNYILRICETKGICRLNNEGDYVYNFLFNATPEMKIKLLESLFDFEYDTNVCCLEVKCYRSNYLKYKDSIDSKVYPLKIAALYHINMICFGTFSTDYAPFPVLFDIEKNIEINNNTEGILNVYKIYKDWFINCKKNNFSCYSFPLLHTKYAWKYGSQVKRIFNELPLIKSETISRKIGRAVN